MRDYGVLLYDILCYAKSDYNTIYLTIFMIAIISQIEVTHLMLMVTIHMFQPAADSKTTTTTAPVATATTKQQVELSADALQMSNARKGRVAVVMSRPFLNELCPGHASMSYVQVMPQ